MNHASTMPAPANRLWAVLEIVVVWAVFAVHAGWPVPDVNEAHYLGKAKHYWQPGWIENDFFLDSADSHLVFYVTCGWLTQVMSLSAAAWCGRIVTWGLLAWGWRRLSYAILPRPGWSVLTAALFVTLMAHMHMAAEWVVGGFEAKGIAYALVFFALAELVCDRWNRALVLLGGATAFHVIVGGWSIVIAGICWLLLPGRRPTLLSLLPGLAGALLLGLFGLVPSLALTHGVDPQVVSEANQIYVFQRLPHHLWLPGFPVLFKERMALLLCLWVMLCAFTPSDERQARLRRFVFGSALISLTGLLITLATIYAPALGAALLRFYWFRLADTMLPLGVAILTGVFLTTTWPTHAWRNKGVLAIVLLMCGMHLGSLLGARVAPDTPRADSLQYNVPDNGDWRAACDWIADHTPRNAKFLTPRRGQSFKWHTGRSEVATWKDIPQNATDIVEWWRRMQELHATGKTDPDDVWYPTLAEQGPTRVNYLARKYGADYVLTEATPPLAGLRRVYKNDTYAVYEVAK